MDFPQSVDPAVHSAAFPLFQRDVLRLCQYFSRYGILTDAVSLARSIWERHLSEL
ncbi:MAG: RIO1 family regulatory kinase/ATPase [Nitrososphaerales archaeon]